jgi:GNAT superfamily N-acetyltransferase
VRIIVYEKGNRDARFYRYIGPLALDRKVTAEMHDKQYGPIYDEPYAVWFMAIDDHGALLGFCTLFDKEKEVFLDNCYVLPAHRGKGIGQRLFAERLNRAKAIQGRRKIRGITMNEAQAHIYSKFGFRLASKRGKYYWLELAPEAAK